MAGAGNGLTVGLVRHSQRKQGETDRLDLRSTASVLDPTKRMAYKQDCLSQKAEYLTYYNPRINLAVSGFDNRKNPYPFRDTLLKMLEAEHVEYKKLTAA